MTPIQLGFSVDGENLCCKVVIIILEKHGPKGENKFYENKILIN
jgi:hypothetical protein